MEAVGDQAPWRKWKETDMWADYYPGTYAWLYIEALYARVKKWLKAPLILDHPEASCGLWSALGM